MDGRKIRHTERKFNHNILCNTISYHMEQYHNVTYNIIITISNHETISYNFLYNIILYYIKIRFWDLYH